MILEPVPGTWYRCQEPVLGAQYPVPGTGDWDWARVLMAGTWNRCRETGTVPGTWYRVPGSGEGDGAGPRNREGWV